MALAPAQADAITAKKLANKILKLDPKKPKDIDLFTSVYANAADGFYPAGSEMVPDPGPARTEAEAQAVLADLLGKQLDGDQGQIDAALAIFDDEDVAALIPDPNLRAAVVGMTGTLLEPSVTHGLTGDRFALVRYGTLPDSSAVAGSAGGDTNRVVTVNTRYAAEDFRYLVGIMGHEFLHDDFANAGAEEAVLNSLSGMTHMQVLLDHPGLAQTKTELSRQMNDLVLAFLNSREDGSPNSEIYAPTGTGVAPGSDRDQPDIWSIFNGGDTTSPLPAPFGEILPDLGLPTSSTFSQATAETFEDLNDEWASDVNRVQISVLLELVSVKTIAKKADLSNKRVIRLLKLKPYLNAIE